MPISKDHILLFTKEACPPCEQTKEFLFDTLEKNLELWQVVTVMRKEHHKTLVETYELDLFPTLLTVGPNGMEMDRVVGGKAVREVLEEKLIEVYRHNNA